MKILSSIVAIFLMINVSASEPVVSSKKAVSSGIEFHTGTWQEALNQAAKEGKPIFLDISASWCGPCKALKKNTFPNEEVGAYYNENFINVLVDGEKGEGKDLANKFKIRGYPTMIYLNSKGEVIAQTSGYRDPQTLINLGIEVLKL
ncbi:MAG: thioredoxin family protein [Bacteroidales bacterium]|nr:thioredoxin family protein [Bacteroidales bacterium]